MSQASSGLSVFSWQQLHTTGLVASLAEVCDFLLRVPMTVFFSL
jgi:hypothetical protein